MSQQITINERTKGIFCILCAAFFFALMNLFIKLSGDIPTIQKALFRNLVAIFFSGFILFKQHISIQIPKDSIPFLLGRAIFGTIGVFFNFYAIDRLNIADASMLNKLSPFFAILFSYFILKEKAKPYQLCCVFAALCGTLFILKPNSATLLSFPALVGLTSGMAAGLAYTLLRRCTQKGVKGPVIVFFFSVFSCLCCVPYLFIHYTPMRPIQLFFLICTGLSATGGQFSITAAYTHAPASELSVYDYSQIFFAGMLGFLFLGELPDALSYIGYVIIIGASIVMFLKRPKTDSFTV